MESKFFQCVKRNDVQGVKNIFENNAIDIMFESNKCIKYAVKNKKIDIIKWMLHVDNFQEIDDDYYDDIISIMTLACRHSFYDLIEILKNEFYMDIQHTDISELISDDKLNVIKKVHSNLLLRSDIINDLISKSKSVEVMKYLLDFGYTITSDVLLELPEMFVFEYVLNEMEYDPIHNSETTIGYEIFFNAARRNRVDVMKFMYRYYDYTFTINDTFLNDLIDRTYEDSPNGVEFIVNKVYKNKLPESVNPDDLMEIAMKHGFTLIAKYLHNTFHVVPKNFYSIAVNYEYTLFSLKFPGAVESLSITDLTCEDKRTFKLILDNIYISSGDMDNAVESICMNPTQENIEEFMNVHTLSRKNIANIFVISCIKGFQNIAHDIWISNGDICRFSSIKKEHMHLYMNTFRQDVNEQPIKNPKHIFEAMLENMDIKLDHIKWFLKIFLISIKIKHVLVAIDNCDDNIVLFLLKKIENISENQLKTILEKLISEGNTNAYYVTKYIRNIYSDKISDKTKYICFKHALQNTDYIFTLFEDCQFNMDTCMNACIYGNNLSSIKFLTDKYPEYNIRKSNDALFKYACLCDSLDIVRFMCSKIKEYSYKVDEDDIIPIIIDTLEYKIHNEKYEEIYIMLKGTVQGLPTECSVCYDSANIATQCNHSYCVECLCKWYIKRKNCPMCKKSINLKKCKKLKP